VTIGLPGLSSNIVVSKDKETHYKFILSTVSNEIQENLFTNVTTIDPRYVIVNQTNQVMMLSQIGSQDKCVEIIPTGERIILYCNDLK
jgi:hypothetical protein